ncbi:MAG: 50S ribosome-binding GTPase [Candidatus Thermoplasmatota archaeon]|nr:50S ribosome-binding GTPase [Candidatus Thermoplasmatota archaeon]
MEAESHKKGGGSGFSVPKSGDATVALVGYPNVGKSSLLNALTGVHSETGNFAFTTVSVIPGTMLYNGARIQILDLPGIIESASSGSGRGREILSVVRGADLILLVTDNEMKGLDRIREELYRAGIVINRKRRNVSVVRTGSNGIVIHAPKKVMVNSDDIREILHEFRIMNADVYIRESVTLEDIIESVRGSYVYVKAIVTVNKSDLGIVNYSVAESFNGASVVKVSARTGYGIDNLKEEIFRSLEMVRIYLMEKSGKIDRERPLILRKSSTVRDVCRKISRQMLSSFKYAYVISQGQMVQNKRVGLDHVLRDGDIVHIVSVN